MMGHDDHLEGRRGVLQSGSGGGGQKQELQKEKGFTLEAGIGVGLRGEAHHKADQVTEE